MKINSKNVSIHALDLEDKQLEILKHYGREKQSRMLVEECGELIVAISKLRRNGKSLNIRYKVPSEEFNNLIEELADVENLIDQIKMDYDMINEGVKRVKEYKVNRELDRISQRYQNKGLEEKSKEIDCKFDL